MKLFRVYLINWCVNGRLLKSRITYPEKVTVRVPLLQFFGAVGTKRNLSARLRDVL